MGKGVPSFLSLQLSVLMFKIILRRSLNMACFLVPAAEAVVTTIAAKVMKNKETQMETVHVQFRW